MMYKKRNNMMKQFRNQHNLTQQQFADLCGVSVAVVRKLEQETLALHSCHSITFCNIMKVTMWMSTTASSNEVFEWSMKVNQNRRSKIK